MTREGAAALCLFCDNPSGSQEHVWSDWLRRYLISDAFSMPDSDLRRVDAELDVTTDRVCDTCNRNWMKKLEDRASPSIKRMFVGEPVVLRSREVFFLRRWAIKTSLVFEAYDDDVKSSTSYRRKLRSGGSPADAVVLIGSYRGERLLSHHRASYRDPLAGDQNLSWVTLVLGQLAIFVLNEFTRHPDVSLTPQALQYVKALPATPTEDVSWPVGSSFDEDVLRVIERGPNPEMRNA